MNLYFLLMMWIVKNTTTTTSNPSSIPSSLNVIERIRRQIEEDREYEKIMGKLRLVNLIETLDKEAECQNELS